MCRFYASVRQNGSITAFSSTPDSTTTGGMHCIADIFRQGNIFVTFVINEYVKSPEHFKETENS